ncbi:conserved uncharacterized protein [Desulfobacula toluolica Tol2]|uniref:Conserved uncharacterized protein n=2 Tax=Desulfobacula toluolica TaxID=28223 RepID=K0NFH1_DESTT|nr:conserved uncharacterized protein [Desulfobacula toluolica Tol2]
MNLILFIHQAAFKKGVILENIIDGYFDGTKRQTLRTVNALKEKLKKGAGFTKNEIFILLVDSRSRLNELTSLIDLLEGKRIILILPDESKTTLSIASKFFPRFFTFVSETYNDLCDVLHKMTKQANINTN